MKQPGTWIVAAVTCAALAFGATALNPKQIGSAPAGVNSVLVSNGKQVGWAAIDPSVVITQDATGFHLSAATTASSKDVTRVFHPTGQVASFVIPDASFLPASLKVYLNGNRQELNLDYSVSGATITFLTTAIIPGASDSVQIDYSL